MDEVIDKTAIPVDEGAPADPGKDSSGDAKDAAAKTPGQDYSTFFENLMDEYDVETPDELKAALKKAARLRGVDVDEALEAVEERKAILKRVAEKRERELRENEEPEDTIARLEKELKAEKRAREQVEQSTQMREQAREGVRNFDRSVKQILDASGLSKVDAQFARAILTSKNPILEVPYDSPKAIKAFVKSGIEAVAKYREAILKEAGKAGADDKDGKKPLVTPASDKKTESPPEPKGTRKQRLAEALASLKKR